ncbi:glycosyltransferase family 2 protein, partial [Nitriliruptoraceae bacterium ZYF776]|nr:glycosyltransferase family 2 protein [Profundirhabdus halotolerans]
MLQFDRKRLHSEPLVSIVVPMFDEEEMIPVFFLGIRSVLELPGVRYEVVCVNDGSCDRTLDLLLEFASGDPRILVIDLSRNFGKEAALSAGLARAGGDAVIVIDADLQDPPELIPTFIERWRDGADVVIGVRVDRTSDTFL